MCACSFCFLESPYKETKREKEGRLKRQQLRYTPNCKQENRACQFRLRPKSRTQVQDTFLKDCFRRTANMIVQATAPK